MDQQDDAFLDYKFSEILDKYDSPDVIFFPFLIADGINLDIFTVNYLYLEIGVNEVFPGGYEPSDSVVQYGTLITRPICYPDWFIAAYPDVVEWFENKVSIEKSNFYSISKKFDYIFNNDRKYIECKFSFENLRNILDYYKKGIKFFECSIYAGKHKTEHGSRLIGIGSFVPTMAGLSFMDGDNAYKKSDYQGAFSFYSHAINNFPFVRAYFKRGICCLHLELYEFSIRDFNSAIELDSGCAVAYFYRGLTYWEKLNQKSKGYIDIQKASELGFQKATVMINDLGK